MLTRLLVACVALLPLAAAAPHHHAHSAAVVDSSNIASVFADHHLTEQFQAFKRRHRKVYESEAHEAHRFALFKENMAKAAELQAKNPEATFGVNAFADLHANEFANQYLNYRPAVGDAALLRENREVIKPKLKAGRRGAAIPADYDWRKPDQNRPVGVTAVKDQGQCGSCWAFSATEEVESAWILAGKPAVALAPEQVVDCDTVDQGCNGGDTVTAYNYIESAGLMADSVYPYTAGLSGSAGTCAYNKTAVVAKISGFKYATPGCNDTCTHQNEDLLATNLYNIAPVSICVDASTWQTYTGGILSAASGCQSAYTALDHCVQLVGYGVDATSNTKYWSVRNSWNTGWGEAGYIRLLYGQNTCGVADEATIVVIA